MVFLKAKQSFLAMPYSVITTSPLFLYKADHSPTDFLNCDNSGTQDEKLEIMIIRDCLPYNSTVVMSLSNKLQQYSRYEPQQ